MDFNFTDEQKALRDTLARYVAKEYSFEARRALAKTESRFSRSHWEKFAELGLAALPFADEFGGLNGTAVDTYLVMEAFGRGLVLEPYLSSVVLAGHLLRDFGNAAQREEWLPRLASGETLASLAHYERQGRYQLDGIETSAQAAGSGWVLSGEKAVVLGGASADAFLVSAKSERGICVFLVPADAGGLIRRAYRTQDGSRAADLKLDHVALGAEALVGDAGAALPAIERAIDYGVAALCAESIGILDALNEATLEYLKTRQQFGQPIGRFQVLQHRMADMIIATEQARSMALMAAVKADAADAKERRRALSAAKAYVGNQARLAGQQAVQLHGGMGVVDELKVSHYFKRLTMINATLGDADHHLGVFSDLLLAA